MSTPNNHPRPGHILVMVGTKKGTFLFWSDADRQTWQYSHHHWGWQTHALSYDARYGSIYAATNRSDDKAVIQCSNDGGLTWKQLKQGLPLVAEKARPIREIWQVQPGHPDRPGEIWVGTREAGLYRSSDRGESWQAVSGLNNHATTGTWSSGGAGLILHTIAPDLSDANRLYIGISTGGTYRSDDGGESWHPVNHGVRADFLPDPYPKTGQCVHKLVIHPARPAVLFQQNHCGVYRSPDRGETWHDISAGLSSRFGFPMAIHPHDPHTIYVVPLISDQRRLFPDRQMAVWRSCDDGQHWEPLTTGLPSETWFIVLREGLATDACDPAGVYVGATNGQVFYSRDEGEHWDTLPAHLPPILSVSAAEVVG